MNKADIKQGSKQHRRYEQLRRMLVLCDYLRSRRFPVGPSIAHLELVQSSGIPWSLRTVRRDLDFLVDIGWCMRDGGTRHDPATYIWSKKE